MYKSCSVYSEAADVLLNVLLLCNIGSRAADTVSAKFAPQALWRSPGQAVMVDWLLFDQALAHLSQVYGTVQCTCMPDVDGSPWYFQSNYPFVVCACFGLGLALKCLSAFCAFDHTQ